MERHSNSNMEALMTAWRQIPKKVEKTLNGVPKSQISRRKKRGTMTVAETVHHIAEANIVAASMIIAAIGKDGSTYDWSWLYPDSAWIERMGYAKAPIKPAIQLLSALSEHVANLVIANPKVLKRKVTLFDTPGGETYTMTVEEIMRHEVSHADEHLNELNNA
jgi:uncharacterized damage-inducible protein DinB